MDKAQAYKIVDDMVFGTKDTLFLEENENRKIANQYIRAEIERGFMHVYSYAKNKNLGLAKYLEKNGSLLVAGDFFENFNLSKNILGKFYLLNRNALLVSAGMDGPDSDKIWNASTHAFEMGTKYGPNLSSYPGLEDAISIVVKSIKDISQKEKLPIDDVIKKHGDRIYKETGKNDWNLGRFGSWHDKSFLYAKYMTTKAVFDSLPFYDVDYDYDHEMPPDFSPFHKGKEGQDFIVLIAQDKDQNSKNPYRRVFFDLNKQEWARQHKPNFMNDPLEKELFEVIQTYNCIENYRIFIKNEK